MPALRYILVFVTAALIIGGGAAFCAIVRQEFIDLVRAEWDKPENAVFVTPEVRAQLDAGVFPHDMGTEFKSGMMWKINIAEMLSGYWVFLSLIVIAGCFLVAYLLGGNNIERNAA
ncbi:MAG: hypothetical protein O2955_17935 [Planctomycetota bacterium]|nr:hypothetical protein [Planctomycetota bacterium]MDA1214393.1 hypothetical protein [Planctomycetota bacterium]